MSTKLKERLKALKISDTGKARYFIREEAGIRDTTSSRVGFFEWLAFIERHNPTELQMKDAIDMNFIKPIGSPNAIHEDWICVEDYMKEYKDKLYTKVSNKLQLTDLGRKVLANLL